MESSGRHQVEVSGGRRPSLAAFASVVPEHLPRMQLAYGFGVSLRAVVLLTVLAMLRWDPAFDIPRQALNDLTALTIGYLLGYAAHALTDVNDSVGTMLLFPFSTVSWTLETWAYAATREGGKYLDAAAYYSSLGLAMDVLWLVVVLHTARIFSREYWRTQVVPADPHIWSWFNRFLPERGLLALYRATFFYGVCRLVSWTAWAHLFTDPVIDGVHRRGYPFDLSWTGPYWLEARSLPHVSPWIVLPCTLALLGLVYWAASRLWEPMGRAQARAGRG